MSACLLGRPEAVGPPLSPFCHTRRIVLFPRSKLEPCSRSSSVSEIVIQKESSVDEIVVLQWFIGKSPKISPRARGCHDDLQGSRVHDGDRPGGGPCGGFGRGVVGAVFGSHAGQGDQGKSAPRGLLLEPPHTIPGEFPAFQFWLPVYEVRPLPCSFLE